MLKSSNNISNSKPNQEDFFQGLEDDIYETLTGYVAIESVTSTEREKAAGEYMTDCLLRTSYFKDNPDNIGLYPVSGDHLNRSVAWALVRGQGLETVVYIHHYDVVGIEDFKMLKQYAFTPKTLFCELEKIKQSLNKDCINDIDSGEFMFGRGVCDMKGGGSVQIELVKRYSKEADSLKGNILLLGLPDEENMSSGMRSAVLLMKELKEKHGLSYKFMINSEPHQRKDESKGMFSTGSVGKIMPFVYVRGYLAHAGKAFEGLNPVGLLSEIVCRTEMNRKLCDTAQNEATPPPTWLYARDSKERYDVSMPLSAYGYFSMLTLHSTPREVLSRVREICETSFEVLVDRIKYDWLEHCARTGLKFSELPWKTCVITFKQLVDMASENAGADFDSDFSAKLNELSNKVQDGASFGECGKDLLDWLFDRIDDASPKVVYGLIPPYYPHVSNYLLDSAKYSSELCSALCAFVKEQWEQEYELENYYTGISDLSYSSVDKKSRAVDEILSQNMPFFEKGYSLPMSAILDISMPSINIGPWGKDFHKMTERVSKEDLFMRTPKILKFATDYILNNCDKN